MQVNTYQAGFTAFLPDYPTYSAILLAVDCIIFGFDEKQLKLLLIKRSVQPYAGYPSLVGSFTDENEDLDQSAERILYDMTGLKDVFMRQLHAFGKKSRDQGARVVSVAYWSLIPLHESDMKLADKFEAEWVAVKDLPPLVLDHSEMVQIALRRLQETARIQPIGYELLPEKFTLPQLHRLYTEIYQTDIDDRNFRKKILSLNHLEKLEEKDRSGSKKGAFLYRFNPEKYQELQKNGFYFSL